LNSVTEYSLGNNYEWGKISIYVSLTCDYIVYRERLIKGAVGCMESSDVPCVTIIGPVATHGPTVDRSARLVTSWSIPLPNGL